MAVGAHLALHLAEIDTIPAAAPTKLPGLLKAPAWHRSAARCRLILPSLVADAGAAPARSDRRQQQQQQLAVVTGAEIRTGEQLDFCLQVTVGETSFPVVDSLATTNAQLVHRLQDNSNQTVRLSKKKPIRIIGAQNEQNTGRPIIRASLVRCSR